MKRKKGYAGKKKAEIREFKEKKYLSGLVVRYIEPAIDAINEEGKEKSEPLNAGHKVHGLGTSAEFSDEIESYRKYTPFYFGVDYGIGAVEEVTHTPAKEPHTEARSDEHNASRDAEKSDGVWVTPYHFVNRQLSALENQVKKAQEEKKRALIDNERLLGVMASQNAEHVEEIETYKKRVKWLRRTVESLCNELSQLYRDYAACQKENMMARAIPDIEKIGKQHMNEMQAALGAQPETMNAPTEAQHIDLAVTVLPFSQKAPMEERHPEFFVKPEDDLWILMLAFIFVVFVLSGLAIYSSRIKENAAEKVETVTPSSAPTSRIFPPFIEKREVPSMCKEIGRK